MINAKSAGSSIASVAPPNPVAFASAAIWADNAWVTSGLEIVLTTTSWAFSSWVYKSTLSRSTVAVTVPEVLAPL